MGVAVAGVVMIITELITMGMMTLTTAGGALGGYLFRGKSGRHSSTESAAPRIPRVVGEGGVVTDQKTSAAEAARVAAGDEDSHLLPSDQETGKGMPPS